ncbi:UNVERIFIED_ORG: ribosomal protein S18 acetylase RimI-like enzyme [Rhizobium sp. SLBN-170]
MPSLIIFPICGWTQPGRARPLATIDTHARNRAALGLYERCGFQIVWRGMEYSDIMKVELEKVKLEQKLSS